MDLEQKQEVEAFGDVDLLMITLPSSTIDFLLKKLDKEVAALGKAEAQELLTAIHFLTKPKGKFNMKKMKEELEQNQRGLKDIKPNEIIKKEKSEEKKTVEKK